MLVATGMMPLRGKDQNPLHIILYYLKFVDLKKIKKEYYGKNQS